MAGFENSGRCQQLCQQKAGQAGGDQEGGDQQLHQRKQDQQIQVIEGQDELERKHSCLMWNSMEEQ